MILMTSDALDGPSPPALPAQPISRDVLVEKYAQEGERELDDIHRRVAPLSSRLQMNALAHLEMVAAVAPYIDAAISKTVNVRADCPYEDFKDLYMQAWRLGLKGLATYRPNARLGAVLKETLPRPACAGCTMPVASG
jgi:ribonucleoside-diphosphate reductase alpha chain